MDELNPTKKLVGGENADSAKEPEGNPVTKTVNAIDSWLELWRTRRTMAVIVALSLAIPLPFAAWTYKKNESLEKDLIAMKADRDAKATQLAPFQALAAKAFESAPPDKRLDLLLEKVSKIETNTLVVQNQLAAITTENLHRNLSPEQQHEFKNLTQLLPKGKVEVRIAFGAGEEIEKYAWQIEKMLKDSGFDTGPDLAMTSGKVPNGVWLVVRHGAEPPFSGGLQNALKEIGIAAKGAYGKGVRTNYAEIWIGFKP
jgi:hypothetical protein